MKRYRAFRAYGEELFDDQTSAERSNVRLGISRSGLSTCLKELALEPFECFFDRASLFDESGLDRCFDLQ